MKISELYIHLYPLLLSSGCFYLMLRLFSRAYFLNIFLLLIYAAWCLEDLTATQTSLHFVLLFFLPSLFVNTLLYGLLPEPSTEIAPAKYQVKFRLQSGGFRIRNLRRGVAIIGAAGSGKTESVVYSFLQHFRKHSFCGVIHDYKHLELTELAYPLFKSGELPFYIVSFDEIFHRVNPLAPRYLPDEESVNEVSRVLLENLLEQKDSFASGSTRFFNDAVEGLIGGLIWKLRTDYPSYCSLPHLIAIYQLLDNKSLVSFLSTNPTSRSMADAFLSGIESERQTAAVRSTLANAFKKISTRRIFMTLSADEVPLDINNPRHPAVVSVVNNPKFETAYSPVIAMLIHTISKQMSVRGKASSFLLMEEAPTIRLLNMHRIPATLRSYDIATIYVMQDKIQNELLYGEKASKAILSNLSYQFFGKVNDPDTAKHYERFFQIVKRKSISTSQSDGLDFDTRITRSEREVSKIRADQFFRFRPGEFVAFADGNEQRVQFRLGRREKYLPTGFSAYSKVAIEENFLRIHKEVALLFEAPGHSSPMSE